MSSPTSAQKSLPLVHGSELSHGSYLSPREPGNKSPVSQEKETMFHHLLSPPGPTIPFPLCLLHTLSFTWDALPPPLWNPHQGQETRLQRDGIQHTCLISCLCAFAGATHSTDLYCALRTSSQSWGNCDEKDGFLVQGPIPTTSAFEALLGPAQLLTCLSLPLAGGEGSFEITQWKSHNPCLAPRQRLNTCELSVMAATLFQQDHTEWLFIPELTLTFLPHLSPKAVLKALFLTYSKERTLSVSVNTA